jgi:hypothetical protein
VTSSETSTMATRSPEVGASIGDADVAAADAVVATVATTTPCSGPMATVEPRGGLPVAAVLTAARGALDERRLVGTAASDLSTLACARAGTVGVTPRTRNTGVSVDPSKSRTHGGSATQLKLEKPCFLFLKGSGGASVAPAGSAMAPAGTSATLVGYSTDDPAAGASTPAAGTSTPAAGASSTSASAARGDGCGGFHLLGGARPTSLTSSFSSDDDEFACVVGGGGESLLLAQSVLLVLLLPVLLPPDSPLLRASPAPVPVVARRRRPLGPGVLVDPTVRRPLVPSAKDNH